MQNAQFPSLRRRIALVDDESLVLDGLTELFRRTADYDVVAASLDARTALDQASGAKPDVALIDIGSPAGEPWSGVALWQAEAPEVKLVVLDDLVRDVHLRRVLKLGVHGYTVKQNSFADILELIRLVLRGEQSFCPRAQARLSRTPYGWQMRPGPDTPGLHSLTVRETEVLTCLAQGYTVKVASGLLNIRPSTVENHKARIMKKLRLHRMVDLARFALREGLLPP